jgi:AbiV family abortive infection protein
MTNFTASSSVPSKRLSEREYAAGIDYCLENARRLIADAKLLDINGRIPSAIGLAIFAWEEIGKAVMLMEDLSQGKQFTSNDWKPQGRFTDHIQKITAPSKHQRMLQPLVTTNIPNEENLVRQMSKTFHEGRLRCFYVDWSPEIYVSSWSSPTNQEYQHDLTLLLGTALPGAEGWLQTAYTYWMVKRQSYVK